MQMSHEALSFNLRLQERGDHKQMVNKMSSQLGQKSEEHNLFFQRICKATSESSVGGIKFREMRSLESEEQGCQISYEGGLGWGSKTWPLE